LHSPTSQQQRHYPAAITVLIIYKGGNLFGLPDGRKNNHIMSTSRRKKDAKRDIILKFTGRSLWHAEALLIHKVLMETNWNLHQAARELQIPRSTLYSKMKKHNIKRHIE
jgi:transcriptional regulator of acetoin/glycerol metabolism